MISAPEPVADPVGDAAFPVIDDRPIGPRTTDLGIGLIGCGGIVNYAHLPAYRAHGLRIVACHDRELAAARSTAEAFAIPKTLDSIDALLANPDVAIVDIAIHPEAQPEVAERALAAGKHILCQKPLGLTPAEAGRIVRAAEWHGRKAAVNQQMRWTGGIAAARQIVTSGYIGTLTDLQILVSVQTPWHMWPWLRDSPQLDVMFHSIHYLDAIRFLAGNPESVTSRHTRYPDQPERAETKTITVLDYASGCQALVAVNHHDHSQDPIARFRILGTDGVIEGDIGLLATYPDASIDTIRVRRNDDPAGTWHTPDLTTLWVPDAFIGPMASLINAIVDNTDPATAVHDNIDTIRVVTAAYQSMADERTIRLADVPA